LQESDSEERKNSPERKGRDHGEPFDLLLLDLTIKGGVGGEETIQRLHEINPEARAIVCSGYSDDPVLANYAAYGFSGVLAKPFSCNELNNAITEVLGKK
jgi:two-component system cell cycle sensor histidine kinase/response regulator CckA